MGREVKAQVIHAGVAAEARVHLDGELLTIGPPVGVKLPMDRLEALAGPEGLTVKAGPNSYEIAMSEADAKAWLKSIAHPRSLAEKLGFKPGMAIGFVGDLPPEITGLAAPVEIYTRTPERMAAGLLFVEIGGTQRGQLEALAAAMPPAGAVWLVYEKGVVKGDDLIPVARAAGLKDTKVCKISATHTGLRFIPEPKP